jgi:hypothetical protein
VDARRLRSLAALLAASLALGGCRFTWNLWARGDLARDVTALLAKQGILVSGVKCRMFGTLRAGACTFPLTSEQTTLVARGLRLRVLAPTENVREFSGGCSGMRPFDTDFVRSFRTAAFRAPELKLRDGGSFDYLYLYQHPTSGRACLQTSYTQEGATVAFPITN